MIIPHKINKTIATLVEQSRAHFEERLQVYSAQIAEVLLAKEGERCLQTLDAKFMFNFTVSLPYTTEGGPLFPPLPAAAAPRRQYTLRRSARKPAGFYAEMDE